MTNAIAPHHFSNLNAVRHHKGGETLHGQGNPCNENSVYPGASKNLQPFLL